ncbi:hypothetical protein BDR05DRAFT_963991 [Suillus weaverae]|nr:hypothetical protein BDR05DRAFT_963991 [Suillus weaverae]
MVFDRSWLAGMENHELISNKLIRLRAVLSDYFMVMMAYLHVNLSGPFAGSSRHLESVIWGLEWALACGRAILFCCIIEVAVY